MGVRSPPDETPEIAPSPSGPSPLSAVLLAVLLLLALVANGRPIGAADTRPTERVAASLVQEGDFDLDEYPDVEDPFARTVGAHRVSIYPVASAVLAAPVFAAARTLFTLDETGLALAGKWAASLFSAAAAALLYLAIGRRRPHREALWTAVVFALGTTVWSTSQALWQHPAAVLAICAALLCLVRAEEADRWAGRAGLPLALAVAARYADVVLIAVLFAGTAVRWPRRIPQLLAWAAPVVALVLAYHWMYYGSPLHQGLAADRFSAPWGEGHLGLLASPGKGLLFFTPIALVAAAGLARELRYDGRALAVTCGAAVLAHWVFVGRWLEWHGGESWGPRLLTDAMPLLFLFLPEGYDLAPRLAVVLGVVSVAVQAMGAFAYDYRWERLRQRPVAATHPELWDLARNPIAFHAERRVALLALPRIAGGKVEVREYPIVIGGARGSRVTFSGDGIHVEGGDETLQDVHEERGARVQDGKLRLRGRWDGLFLRVSDAARGRSLQLRVIGEGSGVLYVGERSFWSAAVRWTTYPISGRFHVNHLYDGATSGGPDILVTLGRAAGMADIQSVALVPRGEPDGVIRLP
jgi:hypothetical protein